MATTQKVFTKLRVDQNVLAKTIVVATDTVNPEINFYAHTF